MRKEQILAFATLACTAPAAGMAAVSGIEIIGDVRFTIITAQLIRIEQKKDGGFVDEPSLFAVNRSARFKGYKVTSDNGTLIIDTGVIRLTYKSDGKPLSAENLQAQIRKGDSTCQWKPDMPNTGNLGGTERTLDGWNGSQALSPGLISRDGWFLLDDSTRHLFTADWVKQRDHAGTDWYLFGYGDDYKAALKSLTTIGGAVPMPRKYALGTWYSRYWPYTSDEYRKIVAEYSEHNFPLDVMVMDMDWHKDGWTGWSWNRKLLPDAEDLLKWFHEQGLAVTLNVHPADGVGPHEDMYADFMRAMGEDPASGETITYDAGNKQYLDTLFKYTHEPLEKEGVDFWWLDWQQYPDTRSIAGLTNLRWLNNYYYKHTSEGGKRGLSFSRWAGWGDHRHPIHFSGDSYTDWKMLAAEVPFTSAAGNVGCFFWSHDIGGHMGNRNEESYTRWCQFGATTAALRSHSTRNEALDRRPWTYPKWAEDSMRISFHLRSELFPYIYSSAAQSCRESIPLNRAMYMQYPNDEKAYKNAQQYFFGDNLLAAPIAMPGLGADKVGWQAVWFPDGVWYNWFTSEQHKGGQEILAAATINEFPIYARGGVPIPMQPYSERMATAALSALVIRCYPGESGKYTLYEDDGLTEAYKTGKCATTELSYSKKGAEITVKIAATKGTFEGQLKEREYIIELPGTARAASATIDGKPAQTEYDAQTHTNRVKIASRTIKKGCVIVVKAENADFNQIRLESIAKRAGIAELDQKIKSVKDLLQAHLPSMTTPDQRNALLAACGIGLVAKNETPYLFPDKTSNFLFAPADIVDCGFTQPSIIEAPNADITISGQKITLDVVRLQGP
ncbi:MAG: DUF5110 domain-containing protein [Armatimonadetes bacterium]|nr:DUF5110 domain-containing protein [Armatimonadota bacterium]